MNSIKGKLNLKTINCLDSHNFKKILIIEGCWGANTCKMLEMHASMSHEHSCSFSQFCDISKVVAIIHP
jgi:hypothetical protein